MIYAELKKRQKMKILAIKITRDLILLIECL